MSTNKTAIVTGGSKGLGRALAYELTRAGWHVVVDGRHRSSVEAAARQIGAFPVAGDVADPLHREELVRAALALGQRLDLVVNNASTLGATPLPPVSDYPLDRLREVFEVNAVAPVALLQHALPHLRSSGGAILNVTSDAAIEPYAGWGGYGASKAALEQLSRILAVEEPGVRVWWVDPGDMRTQMHQDAFPGEDISDRTAPEEVAPLLLRVVAQRPPSGRIQVSDLQVVGAP